MSAQAEDDVKWAYGDVNFDGRIDAGDALWCLQFSVNIALMYELDPSSEDRWLYELTLENDPVLFLYDVDLSYRVDAGDALMILQRSVKLIDHFPAEAIPIPPHND